MGRKPRLGQHFLIDPAIVERIVEVIAPRPGQSVVEIGPGRGALTLPLLALLGELDAVERDRDLADRLERRAVPHGRLRIHRQDALKFDYCALARRPARLRIVGNLPYYISTPLLFKCLEHIDCIRDMVFMLQREVAERVAASPGSSDYGRLSVMLQYFCVPTIAFPVPPDAFAPPPLVESAVVLLEPRVVRQPLRDPALLQQVVSAAFSQRRKMLRNALGAWFADGELAALGIAGERRPETLSVDEFVTLANAGAAKAPAI
jgi:16S rRNA (adenine1518-N6/adenine1519-N6)-dimethyltransferase